MRHIHIWWWATIIIKEHKICRLIDNWVWHKIIRLRSCYWQNRTFTDRPDRWSTDLDLTYLRGRIREWRTLPWRKGVIFEGLDLYERRPFKGSVLSSTYIHLHFEIFFKFEEYIWSMNFNFTCLRGRIRERRTLSLRKGSACMKGYDHLRTRPG